MRSSKQSQFDILSACSTTEEISHVIQWISRQFIRVPQGCLHKFSEISLQRVITVQHHPDYNVESFLYLFKSIHPR